MATGLWRFGALSGVVRLKSVLPSLCGCVPYLTRTCSAYAKVEQSKIVQVIDCRKGQEGNDRNSRIDRQLASIFRHPRLP